MRKLLIGFAALPLLLGACSVSPGDKVTVTMQEFSIAVAPAHALSGRVRFEIDSVGKEVHDLRLMLGDRAESLPRQPDGKLDLTANRPIDEIEEFTPGHYIATSPNLPAGKYLLVCTIHVDQGMATRFVVDPRKKEAS